jgi:hypothetical protein
LAVSSSGEAAGALAGIGIVCTTGGALGGVTPASVTTLVGGRVGEGGGAPKVIGAGVGVAGIIPLGGRRGTGGLGATGAAGGVGMGGEVPGAGAETATRCGVGTPGRGIDAGPASVLARRSGGAGALGVSPSVGLGVLPLGSFGSGTRAMLPHLPRAPAAYARRCGRARCACPELARSAP